MKKCLLFFLLFLSAYLISCESRQQQTKKARRGEDSIIATQPMKAVEDTTKIINGIRAEFERINKAALITKEYNWKSDTACEEPYMEGTITYYYDKATLVKIHNDGAEDHGEWKEDYYFKNDRLIFVFQDNAYGGAVNPTANKYQNRYYFNQDRLIRKIESNSLVQNPDDEINKLIITANRLYQAKDSVTISKILTCE